MTSIDLDLSLAKASFQTMDAAIAARDYDAFYRLLLCCPPWLMNPSITTYLQICGCAVQEARTLPSSLKGAESHNGRLSELVLLCQGMVRRFHTVTPQLTPFSLSDGHILVNKKEVGYDVSCLRSLLPATCRASGYYYPQRYGVLDKTYIRLNPRNTGFCPGRCVFCQRCYDFPFENEVVARKFWSPEALISQISLIEGEHALSEVRHALVVTELFGSASRYLDFCENIRILMWDNGFRGVFSAISHEILSEAEIQRFLRVATSGAYCISLECFANRTKLMAPYKARDLNSLYDQAAQARGAGFSNVMINLIAGLDSLSDTLQGLDRFHDVLDSIGLNAFMPLTSTQDNLRHPESKGCAYYMDLLCTIATLGLHIYEPRFYERSPGLVALFRSSTRDGMSNHDGSA